MSRPCFSLSVMLLCLAGPLLAVRTTSAQYPALGFEAECIACPLSLATAPYSDCDENDYDYDYGCGRGYTPQALGAPTGQATTAAAHDLPQAGYGDSGCGYYDLYQAWNGDAAPPVEPSDSAEDVEDFYYGYGGDWSADIAPDATTASEHGKVVPPSSGGLVDAAEAATESAHDAGWDEADLYAEYLFGASEDPRCHEQVQVDDAAQANELTTGYDKAYDAIMDPGSSEETLVEPAPAIEVTPVHPPVSSFDGYECYLGGYSGTYREEAPVCPEPSHVEHPSHIVVEVFEAAGESQDSVAETWFSDAWLDSLSRAVAEAVSRELATAQELATTVPADGVVETATENADLLDELADSLETLAGLLQGSAQHLRQAAKHHRTVRQPVDQPSLQR